MTEKKVKVVSRKRPNGEHLLTVPPALWERLEKYAEGKPGVDPFRYARDVIAEALTKEGF